jgi:hypothetical protein
MMFAGSATDATPARRLRRFGRTGTPARGFIMGYILFALLVLGIVTAVLSRINDAEADTKWVNDGVIRIKENLQNVRVQVITCSALLGAGDGATDIAFPPEATAGTPTPLADLKCPQGAEPSIGLFDGSAGVFPPTPPRGFTAFVYINNFNTYDAARGPEAVWVETTVSSPPGVAVLNRIQFGASGPDIQVATVDGATRLRFFLASRGA